MEELSNEKRGLLPPQLLNLIPDERGWKAREPRDTSLNADGEEEDKLNLKLELQLGLPGVQQHGEDQTGPRESCSALSLARFGTHSWLTNAGAKRGFLHTVGAAKPQGYDRRQQQQDRREGCANELTLGGESMSGERKKKGCCPPPPSSHGSAAAAAPTVNNSRDAQGRAAVAPVVGWPPVRSFRRNLTNGSSSKQSPERQTDQAAVDRAKLICKKKPLIKINMDGIPIGRKVDLTSCDGYQKLSTAVQDLFRGFLEAQKDLSFAESGEEEIFSGFLDGTGEYVLVYEDNEGDRMLAGDIPWSEFVSTAKRLRVMRRSELPHDLIGANSGKVAHC